MDLIFQLLWVNSQKWVIAGLHVRVLSFVENIKLFSKGLHCWVPSGGEEGPFGGEEGPIALRPRQRVALSVSGC